MYVLLPIILITQSDGLARISSYIAGLFFRTYDADDVSPS
jgi:hypothetical protein